MHGQVDNIYTDIYTRYTDIYTDIYTYLHLGAGRGDINFVNNNKCNNAPHTATAGTQIINDIFIWVWLHILHNTE